MIEQVMKLRWMKWKGLRFELLVERCGVMSVAITEDDCQLVDSSEPLWYLTLSNDPMELLSFEINDSPRRILANGGG